MSLIVHSSEKAFEKLILEKFNLLLNVFDFNPNKIYPYKIEVNIVDSLKDFLDIFKEGKNSNPPDYVVGFAANNGRIFILNKKLFNERGHAESEFENVIVHELCHIFLRRILDPKHTLIWIEEGICQYLAFKDYNFSFSKQIDFRKLETKEDWRENHAYRQSAAFFKFLSEKYGFEKIIEFIKLIKKKSEYEAFNEIFDNFEEVQEMFFKSLKLKNENKTPSRHSLQSKS